MTEPISVRALFFGVYGELASGREITASMPPGSTVGDLVEELRAIRGHRWIPERVVVAVNQVYTDSETPLATGDEVAFIPPVAGG